jgi:hypothetical protein
MAAPQKRCIFCNGLGVTKEHIWAEWLNPYLPKSIVNHEIYSETIFPDRTEATIKKRSGSPQSGRIRRVCRCCNNGWMSLLQEDTKPILLPLVLGEVSSLHKNNQSKLAAWIAMFTMVSEFIDKTETRIGIPATERLFLKEKQIVPPNWKKWIGNYRSEKWKGVWLHSTIPIKSEKHIPKKHDSGLYLPNTQTTTFLVGKLYVHVLSSEIERITRSQDIRGAGRKLLYRLWPIRSSPVNWPPPLTMSDADAEAIASAFINRARKIARARD